MVVVAEHNTLLLEQRVQAVALHLILVALGVLVLLLLVVQAVQILVVVVAEWVFPWELVVQGVRELL